MNKPMKGDSWIAALVARVETEGPQPLEVEGHAPMVVVSAEAYRLLAERKPTFKEFLLSMPRADLEITRDPSPARAIDI